MISEAHSQVYMCADTTTIDRLVPLIYRPVKDSRDFYSLGDILANGQSLDGSIINILAAVKSVGMETSTELFTGFKMKSFMFPDLVASVWVVFRLLCFFLNNLIFVLMG